MYSIIPRTHSTLLTCGMQLPVLSLPMPVTQEAGGMSSSKLAEKMKHLSQERQKQERKFKSFSEIRDKLIKEVEHKADGKNQRDGEPVYSMVKKRQCLAIC